MTQFLFDRWDFDEKTFEASFHYKSVDPDIRYVEKISFIKRGTSYNRTLLNEVLQLAHIIIGVSYFKSFPTSDVVLTKPLDEWQADFFNYVYQEGFSQFAYENQLTRNQLALFTPTSQGSVSNAHTYEGKGIISLQSGGKDSLLVATLLQEHQQEFSSLYISSSTHHPSVIDSIEMPVLHIRRQLDHSALETSAELGGLNGHIPVTYVVMAVALIQAILIDANAILAAIGHEGEEPHAWIGDLPVNHQWSKTWHAEKIFHEYVTKYISANIQVGSPLRRYSELKIAELFAQKAWARFGAKFSSCNRANYEQGNDNTVLKWCANCPKCANSYLLFAPFVKKDELDRVIGDDLLARHDLEDVFKGLLGIDGVMKPFECIGEVDELRYAYHEALKIGHTPLGFDVPQSNFSPDKEYPSQHFQIVE